MNIFGNTVKKILIDKGATQKELAEKMQVNTRALCALLNRDNISLDKMQAIATALNCKLKIELIPDDDKSE